MVRTVPAIILGAGGATAAYEYGGDISGYVNEVARAITHHSTRPTPQNTSQAGLSGEIDSLKKLMLENNRSQVVVVDKNRSSNWGLWPYGLGLVGAWLLYARFVKGWKLSDLMFVSNASLRASSAALKQGIDGLKDYTSKTKEYLTGRLNILEDDQRTHMDKTERIDDKLLNLGDTVDEMHVEITSVNEHVQQVQGTLSEIQDAQRYNSNGIFLLLRVVRELVYHNDFKIQSRTELEQFSRAAPPLEEGTNVTGLEGLLSLAPGPTHHDANAQVEHKSNLYPRQFSEIEEMDNEEMLGSGLSRSHSSTRTEPRVWTRDQNKPTMDKLGLASLKRRT